MRILHLLHDFLPNHVAGVEVYTDHLARRQAREHAVALLFSEVVPEAPDFTLRRGWREGVRTYEIANNQRQRRFEETYRSPAIDRRVREVLDEFRPDVVHVQHLLNLSIDLVPELRRRGLPVVMTLHDHWLACANGGQRFHRELGRCDVLDATRCARCTAHLNGAALGARGLLRRRAAAHRAEDVLDLVDVRPAAAQAPRSGFLYLDPHSYGPGRRAWVAHPPACLEFRVETGRGGSFAAEVAMHPTTFEMEGGGVRFSVSVNGELRAEHTLDPKRREVDRAPAALRVELPPGASRLELRTDAVPPEQSDHCTAAWVDPRVVAPGAPPRAGIPWVGRALAGLARGTLRLSVSAQERRVRGRWDAMRGLGREIDLFLAPSRYLADELVRFGLPAERVVHCDYGFATEDYRRRADLPERCRRFAFLGSLVRHKGVHVLLEAFRSMPAEATLDVHGPLHYDPAYAEALRRLAAHPGIRFAGAAAPECVPRILAGVDGLVVPSIWQENSPLTVHEAFLAGVPVVASRLGGHVELLADGGGLLYDADDPADLAAKLRRLYAEPGLGRRLAATAPPVKTMPDHAAELHDFYDRLLAARGSARARA
jgi:glycosyltransferase involved in cell wall biosynthesis